MSIAERRAGTRPRTASASTAADSAREAADSLVARVGSPLLGDYLRARRSVVQPEEFGLHRGSSRRVGGLRREEVATLANISTDYYLRLEQGRDRQPSDQVLSSLAGALQVGEHGRRHMRRLVELQASPGARRHTTLERDRVGRLLMLWPHAPVVVVDANLDIVESNAQARALGDRLRPGTNFPMTVFTEMDRSAPDWQTTAERCVAELRFRADPFDNRLQQIVGALAIRDAEFRRLWARHDCAPWSDGVTYHEVDGFGRLPFQFQTFEVPLLYGYALTTFHAEPGTRSSAALAYLRAVTSEQLDLA